MKSNAQKARSLSFSVVGFSTPLTIIVTFVGFFYAALQSHIRKFCILYECLFLSVYCDAVYVTRVQKLKIKSPQCLTTDKLTVNSLLRLLSSCCLTKQTDYLCQRHGRTVQYNLYYKELIGVYI